MHTKRFVLKPEGQDPKNVTLELDLLLFDLELCRPRRREHSRRVTPCLGQTSLPRSHG